jgi:hypothetical protein
VPTDKHLAANPLNSRKSTGSKTKAGEEVARCNALQLGFRAKMPILHAEDPAEYQSLARQLDPEYQPAPGVEAELVA